MVNINMVDLESLMLYALIQSQNFVSEEENL